jgi:hypothetical protein
MSDFTFDFSQVLGNLTEITTEVKVAAKLGVQDSVDDLKRIAVDIAPIDSGDLRRSAHAKVTQRGKDLVGEVTFNVTNAIGGRQFNYAIWTHEAEYKLGPKSELVPGTDGYTVGNKYLERPLKGEANKYVGWIADEIKNVVGD